MAAFGTVGAWVDALDAILVDPERVTWPADVRASYLSLAMDALREARPDAFVDEIEIPLVPGSAQVAPVGVTEFVGTPRTTCTDSTGATVTTTEASVVDKNTILAFGAFPSCSSTGGGSIGAAASPSGTTTTTSAGAKCSEWVMKGFESSAATPGFFSVTPPVPNGVTPTIKVRVNLCAPVYEWPADENTKVLCRHKAALMEQLLYYCYQTPQESELAFNRAVANSQRFERMLGFQYRMQARHNSGYFLGRQPDGTPDPQVAR
jgi:hypothetical protein